jgi:hypothetical protein
VKFPAGTVAGQYKIAVNTSGDTDIIRFNNQKLNWTLLEFDVSDATWCATNNQSITQLPLNQP